MVAPALGPEMLLHMGVRRSTQQHALLPSVQSAPAIALPGMAAVLTGEAAQECSGMLRGGLRNATARREPLIWAMAVDKTRYMGEPVAATLALTADLAQRSLEDISPNYVPLPVVKDVEAALAPDAPLLFDEWGENVQARMREGSGTPDSALANAEVVLYHRFELDVTPEPSVESGGARYFYDSAKGVLSVECLTSSPEVLQAQLADTLGLRSDRVQVQAPEDAAAVPLDRPLYPEDVLGGIFAIQLGYPVACAPRSFILPQSPESYRQVHEVTLGLERDGLVRALKSRVLAAVGAYLQWPPTKGSFVSIFGLPAAAQPEHYEVEVWAVTTNAPPFGIYQPVRPPASLLGARLAELVAARLNLPVEAVLRRNGWDNA